MQLNPELLAEEQLDYNRIQQHQQRILNALVNKKNTIIPIEDACTLENFGIQTMDQVQSILNSFFSNKTDPCWNENNVVTCIPAAGAAARYFSEIYQLISNGKEIDPKALLLFQKFGHLPKALIPATTEGDSFLELKLIEQKKLFPCLGNALIVGADLKKKFESKIPDPNWLVLEQGKDLSTIRFNMDGKPFIDEEGKYAPVSAGHGELVHLFKKIADAFPQAQCLHIRNIDNIIGTGSEQKEELNDLSQTFQKLKKSLEFLRETLSQNDVDNLSLPFQLTPEMVDASLGKLFYWPELNKNLSTSEKWSQILKCCERPLSVFGVVKKESGDVGGGPVFAKLLNGSKIKLCMEMPHADSSQLEEYFGSQGKVTHFNPVLTFFELRMDQTKKFNFTNLFDDKFWLLSKREYKGKPVFYHESILYELIGNSETTNLVFIEVPRSLFHPHKSLSDSLGHDRKHYGF